MINQNPHKNDWSDRDVEKHWDEVADIYVRENNRLKNAHDQRFRESVRYLELHDNQLVLNISSRDCEANDYILKENPHVQVINAEISSGLMREARNIRPYVTQRKIEGYSELPFDNEYFNRILTLETLEHVEDPLKFLSELYRISKPGSIMVLSCPPATSEIPYRIFTFLFGGHGEGPHRFMSSREVLQLLQKTGWLVRLHKGTVLIPVGPVFLQQFGEWLIAKFQKTFISELGIRQFFICEKN